jgi:hypothetical protein
VVGDRLAGIARGKELGIALCQGQGATAAHGVAADIDALWIDRRPGGRAAQQVVNHLQHTLLGVVDDDVASHRLPALTIVLVAGEAKPPRFALIHRRHDVGAPGAYCTGKGAVGVTTPGVEVDEKG